MYFRDCKSLCCWKKNPINFLFRVQISPRSCIMDCFPPISFLNISDYRLQPRLFMGWWKDVSNCLYWLHISGSRIMNMLAFSLWHCCLIDITHMCIVTHFGSFLQPFSLHVILCEKNIEIWIILFSPWIILFSPYSWHFSMFYVCFVHKYFT